MYTLYTCIYVGKIHIKFSAVMKLYQFNMLRIQMILLYLQCIYYVKFMCTCIYQDSPVNCRLHHLFFAIFSTKEYTKYLTFHTFYCAMCLICKFKKTGHHCYAWAIENGVEVSFAQFGVFTLNYFSRFGVLVFQNCVFGLRRTIL